MSAFSFARIPEIMRETGEFIIMPGYKNLKSGDIEIKSDQSPATIIDKNAEEHLIKNFSLAYPGSVFIGEESAEKNPKIFSLFDSEQNVIVIDPIDGTRNFIKGKPEFAEMVAIVRHKETIAAWIYDPSTGDMLAAERGSGVWLNGQKMRLAAHDTNAPTSGLISYNLYERLPDPKDPAFPPLEIGSASSFNYARLFTGDALFAKSEKPRMSFLLSGDAKPWDHLAGQLMLKEAGGYGRDLLGNHYDMQAERNNGLLSAPDRATWKKLHKTFNSVIKDLAHS